MIKSKRARARSLRVNLFTTAGMLAFACGGISPLHAQEQPSEEATEGEEEKVIVVTGSFIRRDATDSPSPISILGRESLEQVGIVNAVDYVKTATINTGSEFNADIFSQGGSTGTAQYNLRGLGLGSTLVLVNGRRGVLSGVTANNALQFVDINILMPQIMIDRVEILKDGASTLYGSDAVAGVVNNITRDKFTGAEIFVDYRNGQADQRTVQVDAIAGFEIGESTNLVIGASYVDQSRLLASDRSFATVTSGVGSPGAFFPLAASGAPVGGPQSDPLCGVVGGIPSSFPGGPGVCNFDLAPFTDLVSDDERFLAMVTLRHETEGGTELFLDLNYSHRRTFRTGAPSFPGLRPLFVPLTHPRIGDAPTFAVPSPPLAQLRFFGRPLGTGFDPINSVFEDDLFRVVAGVRGEFNDKWNYDFAITYGENDGLESTRNDVLFDELQAAITSGDFNPFGTALNGVAPNSQAVIDTFRADADINTKSRIFVAEGVVSGDIFELPGGSAGIAIGAQYRRLSRDYDPNDLLNAERFYFVIGGADSSGSQQAYSVFAEAIFPITDWLEVQTAIRYEEYDIDSVGGSVDPKIAVLVRPSDSISLRASFSTAFRAPQLPQLNEQTVSTGGVFDPIAGAVLFPPVRSIGNPDLLPEEANTYNMGATFNPVPGLTFELDYWRFEYDNLITAENATAVVAADPFGPQVIRSAGNVLQEVSVNLINAPSLETDGLDFSLRYKTNLGDSDNTIGLFATATHILSYDLLTAPGGAVQELAGFRNFSNIGTATPRWRANATGSLNIAGQNLAITGRYISSFTNDTGSTPGDRIDDWFTVDAQLTLDLQKFGLGSDNVRPTLAIGAINLFNQQPPFADTTNAFPIATKVHDPRGRTLYVRAGIAF